MQGIYKNDNNRFLTPLEVRNILTKTSTKQTSGLDRIIKGQPNLKLAIEEIKNVNNDTLSAPKIKSQTYNITSSSADITIEDTTSNEIGFKVYTASGELLKTLPAHSDTGDFNTTISGLSTNTSYSIYAVAYNSTNTSPRSGTHTFKTLDTSVKAPRIYSRTYAITTGSVDIYIYDTASNETGFKIYTASGELLKTLPSKSGKGYFRTTLSGLSEDTSYSIYAVAYNSTSTSPRSRTHTFKTLDTNVKAPTIYSRTYAITAGSADIYIYDNAINETGFKIYTASGEL